MGLPAEKPRRATYADLEAVPDHKVAEIIDGALHVFPRPAIPHARAASRLGAKLGGPFDLGEGGPGGWHILDEPELHLGPATEPDVLVPDLAGWRVERMPRYPRAAYVRVAPDWICEILSKRTEATDRAEKMPIYAREGVRHAWLVHPIRRTFESFALDPDGRWKVLEVHHGAKRVRAEPFAELELDLALLWPDEEAPEEAAEEDEAPVAPPPSRPKRGATKKRRSR
jgi:Uma2 family endonuclease